MRSNFTLLTFLLVALLPAVLFAQKPVAEKPRILITTDIGGTWWSDRTDPALYHDGHQGAATIFRHRKDIMEDWGNRCSWLE